MSQTTDRQNQSPRGLNSQRNSPRASGSFIASQSLRKSLKAANSFLDTSYNSLMPSEKSKIGSDRRKTIINRSIGFAFPFYKTPKCNYYNDTIKLAKISNSKKDHFLNQICKIKQMVPSPDKYEVRGNLVMPDTKKRVFSKLPRLTIAAEIIKKGSSTPGPGTYRTDYKHKSKGDHKFTLQRELGFIVEAKTKGVENPLCFDAKYHLVEEKPRFTNFKLSKVERSVRIEKKPGLSPVSYEPLDSFKKTQL